MANYSSYKKIHGDQMENNILGASSFSQSPNCTYGVKWVFGIMCRCSPGCCCNWSVPTGVNNMWVQAWGAGGVYRCCSRECNGCQGCSSYVNGHNLSNFCALGGARGCANPDWSVRCTSRNYCCVSPGTWGGDFAMAPHQKGWSGHWNCTCTGAVASGESSGAPFLSTNSVEHQMEQCWSRCGCWTAPYATGGQGAMTTYCGRCCGQGGQGGSGVVRITYV